MKFQPIPLTAGQLSALKAHWNQLESCMRDANGYGRYAGLVYRLYARQYAEKKLDQFFAVIDAIVEREPA